MVLRKTYLSALVVLAIVTAAAHPVSGAEHDAIYGLWSPAPPDEGTIEIAACGEHVCATIREDEHEPGEKSLDGYLLFENFVYAGEHRWINGTIYDPRNGKSYKSKLRLLEPDKLRVKGCLWFFFGSQIWTRIK